MSLDPSGAALWVKQMGVQVSTIAATQVGHSTTSSWRNKPQLCVCHVQGEKLLASREILDENYRFSVMDA